MVEDRREHVRIAYSGVIFISWKTFQGDSNHVLGKCLDVSEAGIGLELSARIPVGSFVKVRAYGLNLDCSAIVRRIVRRPGGYLLGLTLSKPLDPDILSELSDRMPEPASTSASVTA